MRDESIGDKDPASAAAISKGAPAMDPPPPGFWCGRCKGTGYLPTIFVHKMSGMPNRCVALCSCYKGKWLKWALMHHRARLNNGILLQAAKIDVPFYDDLPSGIANKALQRFEDICRFATRAESRILRERGRHYFDWDLGRWMEPDPRYLADAAAGGGAEGADGRPEERRERSPHRCADAPDALEAPPGLEEEESGQNFEDDLPF